MLVMLNTADTAAAAHDRNLDLSSSSEDNKLLLLKNYYSHQVQARELKRASLDRDIGNLIKQVDQGANQLLKRYPRPLSSREARLMQPMGRSLGQVLAKGEIHIMSGQGGGSPRKVQEEQNAKIKRCGSFVDSLNSKSSFFNYKKGKLALPGKQKLTRNEQVKENYEELKKLIEEKINDKLKKQKVDEKTEQNPKKVSKQLDTSSADEDDFQLISSRATKHVPLCETHTYHESDPQDHQLQHLKQQYAQLSLKNRAFYKTLNTELHDKQKERLGELNRELMRLDKQHIQEQLKTIKRVAGECLNGKKAREQQAYASTMKAIEESAQHQNQMQQIFQEAKELMEEQKQQEAMIRRYKREQAHKEVEVKPISNKEKPSKTLEIVKVRREARAQKTLKEILVRTGDVVALHQAQEADQKKVAMQEFKKGEVIRSRPCSALYKIKGPYQPKTHRAPREYGVEFLSPSEIERRLKAKGQVGDADDELSKKAMATITSAKQFVEVATGKFQKEEGKGEFDSVQKSAALMYGSVADKKTKSQTIRENLLVSSRKLKQIEDLSTLEVSVQSRRPQTARNRLAPHEHSYISKNQGIYGKLPWSRGRFGEVPMVSQLTNSQRSIEKTIQHSVGVGISSAPTVETEAHTCEKPRTTADNQKTNNIKVINQSEPPMNNQQAKQPMRPKLMGAGINAVEDEYETRYLNPAPYVNLITIDTDLKSVIQDLTKKHGGSARTVSAHHGAGSKRQASSIMSYIKVIEKENGRQLNEKRKHDEWKRLRDAV